LVSILVAKEMKVSIYIFMLLICLSCAQKDTKQHNFDWLIGSWIRTNDKEGYLTHEHWTKISNMEYVGLGYTLQDQDTVFKERLRLIKSSTNWSLEVTGVNEHPTLFRLTNFSANSFECENKTNEFPKYIAYSLQDNILLAKISDEENEISFLFEMISSR
jgi:hypothetical protein